MRSPAALARLCVVLGLLALVRAVSSGLVAAVDYTVLQVGLFDELGQPIAGVTFSVVTDDGSRVPEPEQTTTEYGLAGFRYVPTGSTITLDTPYAPPAGFELAVVGTETSGSAMPEPPLVLPFRYDPEANVSRTVTIEQRPIAAPVPTPTLEPPTPTLVPTGTGTGTGTATVPPAPTPTATMIPTSTLTPTPARLPLTSTPTLPPPTTAAAIPTQTPTTTPPVTTATATPFPTLVSTATVTAQPSAIVTTPDAVETAIATSTPTTTATTSSGPAGAGNPVVTATVTPTLAPPVSPAPKTPPATFAPGSPISTQPATPLVSPTVPGSTPGATPVPGTTTPLPVAPPVSPPLGALSVSYVDAAGVGVAGSWFRLDAADCQASFRPARMTDTAGRARFVDVPRGTYCLVQPQAAVGYAAMSPQRVLIDQDDVPVAMLAIRTDAGAERPPDGTPKPGVAGTPVSGTSAPATSGPQREPSPSPVLALPATGSGGHGAPGALALVTPLVALMLAALVASGRVRDRRGAIGRHPDRHSG